MNSYPAGYGGQQLPYRPNYHNNIPPGGESWSRRPGSEGPSEPRNFAPPEQMYRPPSGPQEERPPYYTYSPQLPSPNSPSNHGFARNFASPIPGHTPYDQPYHNGQYSHDPRKPPGMSVPPSGPSAPLHHPQWSQRPLEPNTRRSSQGSAQWSFRTTAVIGSQLQDVFQSDSPKVSEAERKLYNSFKVKEQGRKFFAFGKVFLTLWAQPAGESGSSAPSAYSGISNGQFGERVFSKIRRFVVVRAGHNSCTAVPISTYDNQGVGKRGVRKSDHAIVHSSRYPPVPKPSEAPARGEEGLLPQAIRIDVDEREDKLDDLSRIDFGKVYTIEHNVKVKSLGKVNRDSVAALANQFQLVWGRTINPPRPSKSKRSSSGALEPLPEMSEGFSSIDWAAGLDVLIANGFSEERARSILKEEPRAKIGVSSATALPNFGHDTPIETNGKDVNE